MMRSALLVTLVLAFPLSAADKPEDLAMKVVEDFAKAVKAKEIEAILKLTTVPFVDGDPDKIIKDADELKKNIAEKLEKVKPEEVPTEVSKVEAWTKFREKAEKPEEKEKVKKVNDILGENGQLVTLSADGKNVIILVSIKDGKAKVVGIIPHRMGQ